jgi:type IX secretion system PorP/SprF family membrane protein
VVYIKKLKMMKKVILAIVCLAAFTGLKAQQDAMFTHYMYNTLWLNPAYAGSRDALTLTGIHRSQWVNFDGAPNSQSFTMHAPLMNGKMGAGLSVLNDAIGVTKSTLVALDLAYRVKLTEKSKLAFGLKGLANFYRNNLSELKLDQQTDVAFAQNTNRILPNAGAGVYYSHERFYLGLSTPRLLENQLSDGGSAASKEQRHFFLILGSVFDLTKSVKVILPVL